MGVGLLAALLSSFARGAGTLVVRLSWPAVCISRFWGLLVFHPV